MNAPRSKAARRNRRAALLAAAVFTLTATIRSHADTIRVPQDYPTIQAGINAARDGDEVVIADGVYTGAGNYQIEFQGKAITVRSENGPGRCVVDCGGEGPGFEFGVGEDRDSVLEGLTITNCRIGARLEDSSPTLRDCHFEDNFAQDLIGGGVDTNGGDPLFEGCAFVRNEAREGGGMRCQNSNVTVRDCTFVENHANNHGGGLEIRGGNSRVSNSTFLRNTTENSGGGLLLASAPLEVRQCVFVDNTAFNGWGGGIWSNEGLRVVACTIIRNSAHASGGGGAIFTVGGAVANCILRRNSPDQIYTTQEVAVTFSNIEDGWPGEGNIDVDPVFVDAEGGNFRLSAGSPCIDAANNNAVPPEITSDFDGNPRFVDDPETDDTGQGNPPVVDMGPYEFQGGATLPHSFEVIRGERVAGGLVALMLSDNERMVIEARRPSSVSQPSVQVIVDGFATTDDPAAIVFQLESSATQRVPQWVDFFDFRTDEWVRMDTREATGEDTVTFAGESNDPARFLQPGSRLMRTRISFYDPGIPIVGWGGSIDHAVWTLVAR